MSSKPIVRPPDVDVVDDAESILPGFRHVIRVADGVPLFVNPDDIRYAAPSTATPRALTLTFKNGEMVDVLAPKDADMSTPARKRRGQLR